MVNSLGNIFLLVRIGKLEVGNTEIAASRYKSGVSSNVFVSVSHPAERNGYVTVFPADEMRSIFERIDHSGDIHSHSDVSEHARAVGSPSRSSSSIAFLTLRIARDAVSQLCKWVDCPFWQMLRDYGVGELPGLAD